MPVSYTDAVAVMRPLGRDRYPNIADLQSFLAAPAAKGLRLDTVPDEVLSVAVASGVREFERRAGRTMLAAADTRLFDVPRGGGVIPLRDDLLAASEVAFNGSALVAGVGGYWLVPGQPPYSLLRLDYPIRGLYAGGGSPYQSVSVTGQWGFGTRIPEDAWEAMLMLGALQMWEVAALGSVGLVTSWTGAGGVSQTQNPQWLLSTKQGWQMTADKVAASYRRVAQG